MQGLLVRAGVLNTAFKSIQQGASAVRSLPHTLVGALPKHPLAQFGMSLSRFPQNVADVSEALKRVTMAMTEPVYITTSDLVENALSSVGHGSDGSNEQ